MQGCGWASRPAQSACRRDGQRLTLDSFVLSLLDVGVTLPPPPLWLDDELFFESFSGGCCWELGDGAALPEDTDDSEGPERSRLNSRLFFTSFSFYHDRSHNDRHIPPQSPWNQKCRFFLTLVLSSCAVAKCGGQWALDAVGVSLSRSWSVHMDSAWVESESARLELSSL